MAKKVWIVLQHRDGRLPRIAWEAIAAGQKLAAASGGAASAVLLGSGLAALAAEVGGRAALESVMTADRPALSSYTPGAYVAALAAARDVNCHVDACMGGVTLTYLARLGYAIPPWNFAVDGVTSISVDLHKYGYTAKGASVIVHRTKRLRSHQTFVTDNWLGGLYGSSGILGTKPGGTYGIAARLVVSAPECPQEVLEELVAITHTVCPYSNAVRGNIEVITEANGAS